MRPWPEEVNGEEMLGNVSAMIQRYVDMPVTLADAVALWIVTTWLHNYLELSTFLNVTCATKRCGKSPLDGGHRHISLSSLACKRPDHAGRLVSALLSLPSRLCSWTKPTPT